MGSVIKTCRPVTPEITLSCGLQFVCLPATCFMASVLVSGTKDTCAEIKANLAGLENKTLLVLEILYCLVFLMYLFLLICWFVFAKFSPNGIQGRRDFAFFVCISLESLLASEALAGNEEGTNF